MSLLLLLLGFWGGTAWAGLTEEEVAAEAARVQSDLGGRLLLATVGTDAEKLAERVVRSNAGLEAEVVRLPSAGDPARELWVALNRTGLRCALRVEAASDGAGWAVTPFGNCAAAPTNPTSLTVVLPPEDAASRFVERRLSVTATTAPRAPVAWEIQDGEGSRLSAPGFSSLVKDTATTDALLREQRQALRAHTGLRVTGGVLAASALVPLINNPGLTTAVGEDRAWTAMFLVSSGALLYLVAPKAIEAVNDRQHHAANYYTEKQAQEWVTAYNAQLQADLGLAPRAEQDAPAPAPVEVEEDAPGMPDEVSP